ncbi:MAG: capsule assembly Wzi family protein, partial [Flavihumibacter sp.]|nr:capsule assembly Wzi family protein [Flavihumibacter sp.]
IQPAIQGDLNGINDFDSDQYKFSFGKKMVEKGKFKFSLLPVTLRQQVNTHHPYGWNDGSMIQAKGYQAVFSAGFYLKAGPLELQLNPEVVYAGNNSFETFPTSHSDSLWYYYYNQLNKIDWPEQYGNSRYAKILPGQSKLLLSFGKISAGISTENLWWGPGHRNSLMMSNSAPGFLHFTFHSNKPVRTFLGNLEWRVIAGQLKNSGILPPDTSRRFQGELLYEPKHTSNRYINAVMLAWQPKWVKGLSLGVSRSFFQYSDNIPKNLDGYFPIVGSLFKGNARDESSFGRDQLLSLMFRWVFAKEQLELYGEFGRNDHSGNLSDLALEPEHSRAYLAGLKKYFPTGKNGNLEVLFEMTHLQAPSTGLVRDIPTWYQHFQIRHGYTHRGQLLGAGIGPGSNSQTAGLGWFRSGKKYGFMLERIVRNNDFYFQAFTASRTSDRHWVDLSLNPYFSWYKNKLLYSANVSLVHSLNYQWRNDTNVFNFFGSFSVSYLF